MTLMIFEGCDDDDFQFGDFPDVNSLFPSKVIITIIIILINIIITTIIISIIIMMIIKKSDGALDYCSYKRPALYTNGTCDKTRCNIDDNYDDDVDDNHAGDNDDV